MREFKNKTRFNIRSENSDHYVSILMQGELCTGIFYAINESIIESNLVDIEIKCDFTKTNTHFLKRGDIVIVTHLHNLKSKSQFMVNQRATIESCPIELLPILGPAIRLAGKVTVKDFLNMDI
jgi:hypothetical protein